MVKNGVFNVRTVGQFARQSCFGVCLGYKQSIFYSNAQRHTNTKTNIVRISAISLRVSEPKNGSIGIIKKFGGIKVENLYSLFGR
jgi:hypothetical protein